MTGPMFYLFLYFHFPSQELAPRRHSITIFEWTNECINVLDKGIDYIKIIFQTQLIMVESTLPINYDRKPFLVVQALSSF